MSPSPSAALLPPTMERILDPSGVTFDAAARTLTFTATVPLSLAHILRVVNLTRGEFYFDSTGNNGQGLTQSATFASPVLTLHHRLDGAENTDTLAVLYDDGSAGGGGGGGGDASAALQTQQLTQITAINGKMPTPRTPTTTNVASSATSLTLLAANANRRGLSICNESTSTMRLSFATPATEANEFVSIAGRAAGLQPGFVMLDNQLIVTGAIYAIWDSANGSAKVTEYV